jgi:hypothetical protein
MPTYDQQQTLFCLSMFANISNSEKVITDLANPTVQGKIGQWTILWGPVIYYHDPKNQRLFGLCYAMDGGYKGWNPYIERHLAIFVNCFCSRAN